MVEIDYRQSGVDIDAGNEVVRRIKQLARGTYTPGVLSGVGSFGGLFALDPAAPDPVLVASADGVGTKLKIAFMAGVHHTIGRDLVNHCVNDILVQGARPLFFLDYLATGKHRPPPEVAEIHRVLRAHLEELYTFYGEFTGVRVARKHISWYTKGLAGSAAFRHAMNQFETAAEQRRAVDDFFGELAGRGRYLAYIEELAA